MTKQTEALKLALEALEHINDRFDLESVAQDATTAITAIKEALAQQDYRAVKTYHEGKPVYVSQPEQEPVAWEQFYPDIGKPQLKQEPVAFVKGCNRGQWEIFPAKAHQIFGIEQPLYTTPPKRPWVGLTDAEMQALWDRYAHMEMMRAIEAKLKEKNT